MVFPFCSDCKTWQQHVYFRMPAWYDISAVTLSESDREDEVGIKSEFSLIHLLPWQPLHAVVTKTIFPILAVLNRSISIL